MLNNRTLDFSVLLGFCSLIFWLSAQETLPVPMMFDWQDKLEHAAAYFAIGICSWRALRHTGFGELRLALASAAFCSLYGLSDEWHQSFVPGRETSALDWLADTLGASAASVLCYRRRLLPLFNAVP
ncbi:MULTISPECIES: VanZ family protein [Methylomonas]|uniref:VanZ family protein n=1 Tax=Methylomonas TaxID=416 RepID=UPI00123199FA|nr:VanZ family protein [Methylomonas rhizoryzae]